jgi:TPR repeat protein
MFFLSNHPAYQFAEKDFITEVLVDCYASEKTNLSKIMSHSSAKSHALTQYNVHGFPIMLRQLRALLRRCGLCSLLICKLMHFKGECHVRNGRHYACCVISRQHFQVTRNHAQTLFLQGKHFYEQQSFSEAAKRWGQATLLCHGASHAYLSYMLLEGRHGVSKYEELAFEVASAGVALNCAHSKGVLSRCFVNGNGVDQDVVKGLALAMESAAAGSSFGQYVLGRCYCIGRGVVKDYAEAVRWFRLAAEQGHVVAQSTLGFMYENCLGVAKDDAETVRWYRLAAEQGHVLSQCKMGVMCKLGQGVAKDDAEAARWFRMTAAQGHERADSK